MKDWDILFSAPMIRALLASRKTMTRRPLYSIKYYDPGEPMAGNASFHREHLPPANLPLGYFATLGRWHKAKPGDRMWVKETHAYVGSFDPQLLVYRADYPECVPPCYENVPPEGEIKWRPSIHTRRDASRLTGLIGKVKIERLHDCTEADAIAEGIVYRGGMFGLPEWPVEMDQPNARDAYLRLWDWIHDMPGNRAEYNPWVVAISFDVERRNIDGPA